MKLTTTALCEVGHQGLFHDEEFGSQGGLVQNRARTLHPRLGRFMQRDPLAVVLDGAIDKTVDLPSILPPMRSLTYYRASIKRFANGPSLLPGAHWAYLDGMSTYQYLGSSTLSRLDQFGLTFWERVAPGPICAYMVYKRIGIQSPPPGYSGRADAYSHCLMSCEIGKNCGIGISGGAGIAHEIADLLGLGVADVRDLANNASGLGCAAIPGASCSSCCDSPSCPKF